MKQTVSEKDKGVVLFMQHYSIVVKGMEKKLADKGFYIRATVSEIIDARMHAGKAGLFIVYLPDDITENLAESKVMLELCELLASSQQRSIVIGENKYHQELVSSIPSLENYPWIDRPVDMDNLCKIVEEELSGKKAAVNKRKILIIDDDPSYASMVRGWITSCNNYQVNIVTGGMQAITFLLKTKVDLILLDYEMPVVDGPQVFQMLRSEETTKNIPVVFLTGVGTREGVTRVMSLKPDGYILKSTTKEGLLDSINGVLARYQ